MLDVQDILFGIKLSEVVLFVKLCAFSFVLFLFFVFFCLNLESQSLKDKF